MSKRRKRLHTRAARRPTTPPVPFFVIESIGGEKVTLENAQVMVGQRLEGRLVTAIREHCGLIVAWLDGCEKQYEAVEEAA